MRSSLHTKPAEKLRYKSTKPTLTTLVLLAADLIALLVSGALAAAIANYLIGDIEFQIYTQYLLPLASVLILGYFFTGLYPGVGLTPVEELRKVIITTTLIYISVGVSAYLLTPKTLSTLTLLIPILIAHYILSIILIPLNRALVRHFFAHQKWWGRPVIVLGAGETGQAVVQTLLRQPGLGLKPIALFDSESQNPTSLEDVPVIEKMELAPILARELGINHAIVVVPGLDRSKLSDLVELSGSPFTHLTYVPDLFELPTLWVTPRDLNGVLGLEIKKNFQITANRILKRALDYAIGIPAAILSAPIIGVFALLIKVIDPGPAFYWQEREGYQGKPIRVVKLRTMYVNAEERLKQLLEEDPSAKEEWNRYFKLKNDPRVLPVIGNLLRKTSIDELPQLWNVLRGDMSLVGPRPFPYYHLDKFSPRFRELRKSVPPGMTGLWQVSARSEGDLKTQEILDTYYIKNWSIWLDIYILARTVIAVFSRKGAY